MADRNRYYQGPVTDHFDGVRFFNPGHRSTDRSLMDLLRWKLGEKTFRWPRSVPARQAVPEPRVDHIRLTMVGHSTVLIQAGGLNMLTDLVWSERVSPFSFAGPKRVTPPGIAFGDLPPIDAVLLSHNHYDHLDITTLARLHAVHRPMIVTPLGNDAVVKQAIPDAHVTAGDWGDCVRLGPEIEVYIVPANHWSARWMRDRRMALWGGFMLRTRAGLAYYAGDTGYGDGSIFRTMREQYGMPDLALIPIGAYAPRWFMADQHIDPTDAVSILRDLDARQAIGIHWGSFQLTDEPREEPLTLLAQALAAAGIAPQRFLAAEVGDVFDFGGMEAGPADN